MKFKSHQQETTYTLQVICESSSREVKTFDMKFDVTELFDSYGYMHRLQVKDKVIKWISQIKAIDRS